MNLAVAHMPGESQVHLLRAEILHRTDPDESQRSIERALHLDPDNPLAVFANARSLELRGERHRAAESVAKALRRRPGDEDLIWLEGVLRLLDGDLKASEGSFLMLERLARTSGSPYRTLAPMGLALVYGQSSPDEGAAALSVAVHEDLDASLQASITLSAGGLEQHLLDVAQRAVYLQREDIPLGVLHTAVLQMTGQSDQAITEAERVLQLRPEQSVEVLVCIIAANADADQNRFSSARKRLRHALDLNPARLEALLFLHQTVIEGRGNGDDVDDLRRRIQAAAEQNPSPQALEALRQMFLMLPPDEDEAP